MVEPGCWDDNLMDEDIESLLNSFDFPLENFDEDGLGFGGGLDSSLYEFLGPIPSNALMGLPPVPRADIANSCLNAVSNSNAPNEFPEAQGSGLFQSQSPVSVLEQSSFCSGGKSASFNIVTKRRRSTRARSSTLNPWLLMAPLSSTAKKIYDVKKGNEKKKRKQAAFSGGMESNVGHKCTHCQVTKTPQWREGPLGPKTLCNACGVRYRKGRLFPEYRPAASPTFIPTVHSNSHRKVIEMRRKAVEESLGDIPDEIFARPYNSAGNLFL